MELGKLYKCTVCPEGGGWHKSSCVSFNIKTELKLESELCFNN